MINCFLNGVSDDRDVEVFTDYLNKNVAKGYDFIGNFMILR